MERDNGRTAARPVTKGKFDLVPSHAASCFSGDLNSTLNLVRGLHLSSLRKRVDSRKMSPCNPIKSPGRGRRPRREPFP